MHIRELTRASKSFYKELKSDSHCQNVIKLALKARNPKHSHITHKYYKWDFCFLQNLNWKSKGKVLIKVEKTTIIKVVQKTKIRILQSQSYFQRKHSTIKTVIIAVFATTRDIQDGVWFGFVLYVNSFKHLVIV